MKRKVIFILLFLFITALFLTFVNLTLEGINYPDTFLMLLSFGILLLLIFLYMQALLKLKEKLIDNDSNR